MDLVCIGCWLTRTIGNGLGSIGTIGKSAGDEVGVAGVGKVDCGIGSGVVCNSEVEMSEMELEGEVEGMEFKEGNGPKTEGWLRVHLGTTYLAETKNFLLKVL